MNDIDQAIQNSLQTSQAENEYNTHINQALYESVFGSGDTKDFDDLKAFGDAKDFDDLKAFGDAEAARVLQEQFDHEFAVKQSQFDLETFGIGRDIDVKQAFAMMLQNDISHIIDEEQRVIDRYGQVGSRVTRQDLQGVLCYRCPHCEAPVETKDVACAIFRHGVHRVSGVQLNQHANKVECDAARATHVGCCKPYELVRNTDGSYTVAICEYK